MFTRPGKPAVKGSASQFEIERSGRRGGGVGGDERERRGGAGRAERGKMR